VHTSEALTNDGSNHANVNMQFKGLTHSLHAFQRLGWTNGFAVKKHRPMMKKKDLLE
jgi:hypothetical protein